MNSLTNKQIKFKDIERIFFEMGCEVAQMLMQEFLAKVDKELAEGRDKTKLRHKGIRTTTIKTLMGEVELKRALYKRVNEDGGVEYVYLLDEALGFDTIGNISPNLVEKIVEHSCESAYREVSSSISELTNQTISHQGVWNVVQAVGEKQKEAEEKLVEAFENDRLSGDKKIPILFEEADGIWLSMQGKSRKNSSKGKKEMKVGVIYEGWEKRYPSAKEYKTVEKTAFAGYMKPDKFNKIRDAIIAEKYDVDEIVYRILNGDGAPWIRTGHDLETDIFQLDPYHLAKNIVQNVYDKQSRRQILKWLKAGEIDKSLEKIEKLKYECGGVENEVKKLDGLQGYIKNNVDGIVVYKKRKDFNLPKAPEGIEYRTLGTMERNINIFAKRMKGGKSWSEKGASNLSKIIALKMGKGFKDKVVSLVSGTLSERITERFEEVLKNSKTSMDREIKNCVYPIHQGKIPFIDSYVTNGRKVIRKIFDLKPFSEMIYR